MRRALLGAPSTSIHREAPMGRPFLEYLDGPLYMCKSCKAHLARVEAIVSRSFHSRSGKAYLFDAVVNVSWRSGEAEERIMTTGKHMVHDIHCNKCLRVVGWRYERAFEQSQKYKEGKFVLERAKLNPHGRKAVVATTDTPVITIGAPSDEDDDV